MPDSRSGNGEEGSMKEDGMAPYIARIVLYFVLVGYGLWTGLLKITAPALRGGFPARIDFPIYRIGRSIFSAIGPLPDALGGTFLIVILPIAAAVVLRFVIKDSFIGPALLWWGALSIMLIAPYIADAVTQMLIQPGVSVSGDWNSVLYGLGLLEHTRTTASVWYYLGRLLMIVMFVWGAKVLKRQYGTI